MIQFVSRKGKFDAGHRVMHEKFKCFNIHGHEYHYDLTFSYKTPEAIGYAIDFKEIKRVGCQWIDDILDHSFILNPKDEVMVKACCDLRSKTYSMRLTNKDGFCNPTAENLVKELFFAISILLNRADETKLTLHRIKLHETVNCSVECFGIPTVEWDRLVGTSLHKTLIVYKTKKGEVEYDDRRV